MLGAGFFASSPASATVGLAHAGEEREREHRMKAADRYPPTADSGLNGSHGRRGLRVRAGSVLRAVRTRSPPGPDGVDDDGVDDDAAG